MATLRYWAPDLEVLDLRIRGGLNTLGLVRERLKARRGLRSQRQLFAVIAAEASSDHHPARSFMVQRQALQLAQLAALLNELHSSTQSRDGVPTGVDLGAFWKLSTRRAALARIGAR